MKSINQQRGVGLIEALIAAIVFAVGIAAVVQLQGTFFKNSSSANARFIAMGIAQEKIEDLRGFQVTDSSDADISDFTAISNNGGGQCSEQTDNNACPLALPSGGVAKDNITFNRSWAVTNYYYNNNAGVRALTTTANGDIVQKQVTSTVTWTDTDGTPQTASLSTVISSTSPAAATGVIGNNIGGSGEKPKVSYTASTDARVTPIGVGTDTKRETLVPSSQTVDGYTRTKFTANTYTVGGKLVREEEFQNVACECRFDGSSAADSGVYTAAYPKWDSAKGTYVDKEGEQPADKAKGCVQGGDSNCASNPEPSCNACCRDHHDISSVSRKYDPYRSSDDFTDAGDHKHYKGTNVVTSGSYLEACRMKRVNGYWRVYQDWHLVALTVLPLSDLTNLATKATYANYVKAIIDTHLNENKVSGETLSSPPTKPASLDHTTSDNFVNMVTVDEKKDLTARAVYLDYIDSEHLTKVKEKKTASEDYLLHLPFYEIEVAQVATWSSANADKIKVGPYDGAGPSNDLFGGQMHALATDSATINVTGAIRRSNSGIVALSSAVDYDATTNPDSQTHPDHLSVCAGGSCSSSSSSSSSSSTSSTSSSSSSGGSATCNVTVSGTVKNNKTYAMAINGTTAISCTVIGSSYICPTESVDISGTTIVISETPDNKTKTIVSPNACGAVTANF